MTISIRPLDTLFFRDGKPFSLGEETWADGVFPPYPSTLFGALRTWYIAQHPAPFSKEAIEQSAKITIIGVGYSLCKEVHTCEQAQHYIDFGVGYSLCKEVHLPMPLDLVAPKGQSEVVIRLQPTEMSGVVSNYPCPILLLPPDKGQVEEVAQGLMTQVDLETYLYSTKKVFSVKKLEDFLKTEPKIGIGRNDATLTASDALLYRVGMRRPVDWEIVVDVQLPDGTISLPQQAFIIKLGAENKVAEVRSFQRSFGIDPAEITLKGNRFKLYLATPAIFDGGWKPDLSRHGIRAELVAAAVGKPLSIGGFDMEKGVPKTMYKAVPAGSVYFYETSENLEVVKERLFGKPISDKMPEQGFGIAYVGVW
jgi:CRISPR-associated protein Cmr3